MTALGLMSGTSMDGIDAGVIVTDGEGVSSFGPFLSRAYAADQRRLLRSALDAGSTLERADDRPEPVAAAEDMVTAAHGDIAEALLDALPGHTVDVVGFHGHTIFHAPERRLTVQIGDGQALADRLGIPVVYDMRRADVEAGGEGAPLAPVYHRALVRRAHLSGNVAVVNIGGVANVTRIGADGAMAAADTGPGNALIDDLMLRRTGHAMDVDGAAAAAGTADGDRIAAWLADPWFSRPLPKSLDREAFAHVDVGDLSVEDGAATLAGFTSGAILKGIVMAGGADRIVVVGGGAHNPVILRNLSQSLGKQVETSADLGWDPDAIEAQAFAYLAVRSLRNLPLTFPGTTGVARPLSGGRIARSGAAGGSSRIAV